MERHIGLILLLILGYIAQDVKYMQNEKLNFIQRLFASKPVQAVPTPPPAILPQNSMPNIKVDPSKSLYMDSRLKDGNQFIRPRPAQFTVYNPDPSQTDSRPREMASGKEIYDGAAASGNRNIPLGTKIFVPELGRTLTVEDRMNKRYHAPGRMDYFDIATTTADEKTKFKAKQFGRQNLSFVPLSATPTVRQIYPTQ